MERDRKPDQCDALDPQRALPPEDEDPIVAASRRAREAYKEAIAEEDGLWRYFVPLDEELGEEPVRS